MQTHIMTSTQDIARRQKTWDIPVNNGGVPPFLYLFVSILSRTSKYPSHRRTKNGSGTIPQVCRTYWPGTSFTRIIFMAPIFSKLTRINLSAPIYKVGSCLTARSRQAGFISTEAVSMEIVENMPENVYLSTLAVNYLTLKYTRQGTLIVV